MGCIRLNRLVEIEDIQALDPDPFQETLHSQQFIEIFVGSY
jgi:hypothetical protein